MLKEEITPTLTKLKEERSSFLEYQKIIRELEHLNKLYIAYKFFCAEVCMVYSSQYVHTHMYNLLYCHHWTLTQLTWMPSTPRRPAVTLTFGLLNLMRLSVGANELFVRYRGNEIRPDEGTWWMYHQKTECFH